MHLPTYTKKTFKKGATGSDKSALASKADFASLKTKAYNLDAGKTKVVTADLSKLNNLVIAKLSKRLNIIIWLSKSILLTLRYQTLVD